METEKKALCLAGLLMLVLVLMSPPAFTQEHTAMVEGVITDSGKPLPNVQVVVTSLEQGRKFKTKTDGKGGFVLVGLQYGNFKLEVISPSGEVLATRDAIPFVEVNNTVRLDLKDPNSGTGHAGGSSAAGAMEDSWSLIGERAKPTKAELAKIEADNKKIAGLNSLIAEATSARQAQDWPKAENALKQLIAAAPDSNRWDFYMFLGEAQSKSNKFQDAAQTFEKGIDLAGPIASGKVPPDAKVATMNPTSAKAGIVRMLTAQGSAYLKAQNADQGIASLKKASDLDPTSGLAAYNLCGVAYTAQKVDEAKAACNKYLQIEPSGAHAVEVKDFLTQMGQK
jgi:TolA-binding protein